jgi:hypothetical protein
VAESLDTLVADSDRSAAGDELRSHYDSGRLTVDEFEDRLANSGYLDLHAPLYEEHHWLLRRRFSGAGQWSSLALSTGSSTSCASSSGPSRERRALLAQVGLLGTLVLYVRRLGRRSAA